MIRSAPEAESVFCFGEHGNHLNKECFYHFDGMNCDNVSVSII